MTLELTVPVSVATVAKLEAVSVTINMRRGVPLQLMITIEDQNAAGGSIETKVRYLEFVGAAALTILGGTGFRTRLYDAIKTRLGLTGTVT